MSVQIRAWCVCAQYDTASSRIRAGFDDRLDAIVQSTRDMIVTQDAINRRVYGRPELVRHYAAKTSLIASERAALAQFHDELEHVTMLELGCGAGRFTAHVQGMASRFIGVDISPHMVRHCRARFPSCEFTTCDMRELALAEACVDVVFGVSNVLDVIDHVARLRLLDSLHRVLAPGGLLMFSSHNRAWSELGHRPKLELTLHPLEMLRRTARYVRGRINQAVRRRWEQYTSEFAIVTDDGHDYELFHYYIARDVQARQLAAHGFELLATYDMGGMAVDRDASDRSSSSLMYVARRT